MPAEWKGPGFKSLVEADSAAQQLEEPSFLALVQNAPFGIYVVDSCFRFVAINKGAEPPFRGIDPLIGRDFAEIVRILWPEPFATDTIERFRHTLATGEPYFAPKLVETRHNIDRVESYDWQIQRLTLPNGTFGVACYFYDLTLVYQAETALRESEARLREADRRKDEFLATLAHELRNPLTPLRTGLETIRHVGDSPDAVADVRTMMERQLNHMVRLIDDLLDVSRITTGIIHLHRTPSSLDMLLRTAIEAHQTQIDAGRIAFSLELPHESVVLDVDPTRFVQVISNLLDNAVKYTDPGGQIRIAAKLTRTKNADGFAKTLVLTLSDSGAGISETFLPQIFEPFSRGDAEARRVQGLGIGLALARRLIEMHGGSIDARSEGQGLGSEFTIRLPVADISAGASVEASQKVTRINRRVVVIDDDADVAKSIARLVSALGGEARVAHSGEDGLALIRDFRPDVVLLDIGMAKMDGIETCRRIRKEFGNSPFVAAMTGWGREQDKQAALRAGFDIHLTKPPDPEELLRVLAGI